MSISVLITYNDSTRQDDCHPFSVQSVFCEQWLPLAKMHGLETLQRLEHLFIKDRDDAEQLIRELRVVEKLLRKSGHAGVPEITAQDMRCRLDELFPVFDNPLSEWENVQEISI